MPFSHLILCHPLLLLPPIPPSIRVFSNESTLHMRWPKRWSFSFSISPSKEHPGLTSFRMDWLDLLAVQETLRSLLQPYNSKASILQCSAFFTVQLSHPYMTTGKTIALTRLSYKISGQGSFLAVQWLSHVRLYVTTWTVAHQASLPITNSWSLLKFMSIELVMSSNYLILCRPLLPPSIFPSIRVFFSESILCIRWLKYWSFSFSISPSSEYSGLISFQMDWFDLLAV